MNICHERDEDNADKQQFITSSKISKCVNRLRFLRDCIKEQVLPRSAPKHLWNEHHPFGNAARTYLQESCSILENKIYIFRDRLTEKALNPALKARLSRKNVEHRASLKHQLNLLCQRSRWKEAGNPDIVENISSRKLKNYEIEALSLGLKFDTGRDKCSYVDQVCRNYNWQEDDIEKGFIQGILMCCKSFSERNDDSLPRRYMEALNSLAKDDSIVITQTDKGSGIVIMDRSDYLRKMHDLIQDATTYEKTEYGTIQKVSEKFNKDARKILNRSKKGKQFISLLEESPNPPRMRGLPKLHKENIPMRPITSGIGSAPHKLSKMLAKPLTKFLGIINHSHLRNTNDLITQIKDLDLRDKFFASLDVKSLFTNVSIEGVFRAINEIVNNIDIDHLPLPKIDYLKLLHMCMKFGAFTFNSQEYYQKSGLPMGSPLSPLAACFYMGWLEREHYLKIMGKEVMWFRYVDDILLITPKSTNLAKKLKLLNLVEPKIQFSIEYEIENKIPF